MKAGSEAAFQQQVLQLAGFYGWRSYHTHDSRRSQPGFPDLVLVRAPELLFVELKTDKGRIRPEQADWIAELQKVADAVKVLRDDHELRLGGLDQTALLAVEVYLWRPADFDELHARLAAGRHRSEPLYRQNAAA